RLRSRGARPMKKRSSSVVRLEKSISVQDEIGPLFNRAIVDSPIPLIIHDEHDRILQISKGWTQFSGYTIEDIPTIGEWRRRAYGVRKPPVKQDIDELFRSEETVDDGEWVITAKDGSKRIWHFMVTPLGLF